MHLHKVEEHGRGGGARAARPLSHFPGFGFVQTYYNQDMGYAIATVPLERAVQYTREEYPFSPCQTYCRILVVYLTTVCLWYSHNGIPAVRLLCALQDAPRARGLRGVPGVCPQNACVVTGVCLWCTWALACGVLQDAPRARGLCGVPGGDGVILHASNLFTKAVPPIVSFNLGSLGSHRAPGNAAHALQELGRRPLQYFFHVMLAKA